MAVVTISRDVACETEVFAKRLAERLGYSVLDRELVTEAARQLEILRGEGGAPARERESPLLRFIDRHTATTIQKVIDRVYGRTDNRAYYETTVQLVMTAAQDDNVIIMGWGGQCILKNHSRAVHLRVVKQMKERLAWLKANLGLDQRPAQDLIDREDEESAAYIMHYFNEARDDARLYHLVVNLSKIPMEEAVDLVAAWLQHHERE
jgi:cytidylate kinase